MQRFSPEKSTHKISGSVKILWCNYEFSKVSSALWFNCTWIIPIKHSYQIVDALNLLNIFWFFLYEI